MLSSTIAGSCKQSRGCQCKSSKLLLNLWIEQQCKSQIPLRRSFTATKYRQKSSSSRPWINTRSITSQVNSTVATNSPGDNIENTHKYREVLSVALDQSNVSIAQLLIDNTFTLLRKGRPESAWECYHDLTSRDIQKYISREQYRQLIKLFNHAKSNHSQALDYVLTLVEDMKQLGYQVARKEKLLVMRLLGQNGNLTAMEKVFEDLKSEQLLLVPLTADGSAQKPFNIMLTSYGEHVNTMGGDLVAEKSMEIYGEMLDRNIQPTASTTRLLMDNIKFAERSDEITEKVWEWLWSKIGMNVGSKAKELDPALYRDMVMYFASAGRPEYALEINDIMTKRKIPRTVKMITALIHKVGRAGNIDKAMDLLNEMMIVEGLVPTLVTFNALIDIHAHKKPEPDIEGANRIYNMLTEVGFTPNIWTFGTLIDMFAKKGDLAGAKQLYLDMIKIRGIEPSPHIYSSFIECYTKAHDLESAMEILQVLKKRAQRNAPTAREAYNLMFKGLVEVGSIREAIMLLDVMCKDNMLLEARTFSPLLSYYAKRGDPVSAHKVASMMTEAKVKPTSHTYAILLNSYAKAGNVEGAENIFNILKQKYRANSYAYNAMLYAYTKNNDMDKVLETYKRMSKAYVPADEYTYGILMYFYSRRKEIRAVESLIKTMQSNSITPSSVCWTILMQTYFELDRFDDGKNIMDSMIKSGVEISNETWGVMIDGCIRGNQLEFAESILKENVQYAQDSSFNNNKNLLKNREPEKDMDYEKILPQTIEDVLKNSSTKHPASKKTISPYLFTSISNAHKKANNYTQAKKVYNTMCQLSIPITIPAYVTLMSIFEYESNHQAVEKMWQALYNPTTKLLENLDPLLEKPIPVPAVDYDYTNLLTLDQQPTTKHKPITAEPISPFALSIYLRSLISQQRSKDIEALWQDLTQKGYQFDEHNWNRYIVGLIESGKSDEACQVIYDQFLNNELNEDAESSPKKSIRKRDDIFISNEDQLHARTCALLADALEISGAEIMGKPRLRSTIADQIKKRVNRH